MNWYFKVLSRRPQIVVISVAVFSIACIVVALITRKIPRFDDPTLGFEARGTSIGQRRTAWRNLLKETRTLIVNPKEFTSQKDQHEFKKDKKNKKNQNENNKNKNKKKNKDNYEFEKKIHNIQKMNKNGEVITYEEFDGADDSRFDHRNWEYGRNMTYVSDEISNKTKEKKRTNWKNLRSSDPPRKPEIHMASDGYFCESPDKEYAHFVIKRINYNLKDSLFELNAIWAMCDLERHILLTDGYLEICQKELTSDNCCRPWSIPNYIAAISNKTSCFDLNDEDVQFARSLLIDCYQYYVTMKLGSDCKQSSCMVPNECTQHNAIYNVLHYLADSEFIKMNETTEHLSAAMIFLPIASSTKSLPFYHNLAEGHLLNPLVSVVAMDMGLKNALFDELLFEEGWLVALGGVFVIISMWIYTKSLFVTLMTVIAITFSLGIAYFTYTLIFELNFFPFMNLLAVILVVGIGADDAFIFIKIWNCVVSDRIRTGNFGGPESVQPESDQQSDYLAAIIASTFKHAILSMLVTTLTTASALYASYVNSIIAIKCFGIFSGTAVLANYLLMITWLPATVSIAERITCFEWNYCKNLVHKLMSPLKFSSQLGLKLEDMIISLVIDVPILWIVVLGVIGIMSGVLVLYWPKLRLSDSTDLKLFVNNHPFELYDSVYKEMFRFEKFYTTTDNFRMPLRFVWGVKPVDNGNFLDPSDKGELFLDESFNISLPESQEWLFKFCSNLKNQSFVELSPGILQLNCFIERFVDWMGRRCNDEMGHIDRTPCCETSSFPYSPEIFDFCLPELISSLYETPRFFIPSHAGPKFERPQFGENNTTNVSLSYVSLVKAVVIEYESTQIFTMSYPEIELFVQRVENWLANELKTAPPQMQNVFFTSELDFFDLQATLSSGTIISICLAMCVALLVLLLVTLNVLISLYAIITVTFTIFTTVAILVVLGWKLNILESVVISTAIGLAVDFSLHYGVHYRLSPEHDRKSSTKFALTRMIGPTSMAAITTGLAGAFVLPSKVLPYIQIGIFLVLVMSISWIYSTFFLMSLLRLIGPQYGFGQFRYPKLRMKFSDSTQTQIDASNRGSIHQNTVSEQLLSGSSSAAGDFVGSESHELDSLTSNSIIKPIMECSRPINFDRAFKKKYSYPREQSPSTTSAITVVLPDDTVTTFP